MKRLTFLSTALIVCAGIFSFAQNSAYPTKVLEYRPAPGQFINEMYPAYEAGDTPETMNQKALSQLQTPNGLVSLGAFGGYIVFAFDHPVVNSGGDYDFKAYGNADFSTAAEPGIVMVSKDVNKNGLPDDAWYELKGSEYENCAKNYEITYFRPTPLDGDVAWEDNQGASGFVKRNDFHKQESYFPLWMDEASLTFRGTRFPESALNQEGQFGYVDNTQNTSELSNFKIDWAIDENGESVYLSSIDFVKVYTAVNKDGGVMGEISTELRYPAIEDLHPNMTAQLPENTLDPNKNYHILNLSGLLAEPESVWEKTLSYDPALDPDGTGVNEFSFGNNPYVLNYATTWEGFAWEGFTYSNITDRTTAGYDNQFAAITGGGAEGAGTAYAVSYYSTYSAVGKQYIAFANDESYQIAGAYVTNSTLTYLSMRDGDGYAKKFGGEAGTDPDWYKITFIGEDAQGETTGSVDFYLADFRSDNPAEDYIVNEWKWVDLTALGEAAKVRYELTSSDVGDFGINTPTFFCLDKMAVEAKPGAISEREKISVKIYPNPTSGELRIRNEELGVRNVRVFDMMGRLAMELKNIDNKEIVLDISGLANGVYFINVDGKTVKVVKR